MTKVNYKKKGLDSIVLGLALFAMFFGAGNLLFPTDIGVQAGTKWLTGYLFYFLADAGLAILAVIAMVRVDGDFNRATGVIGKIPSAAVNTAVILCIGPVLAIPRTAATTYEMGVAPVTGLDPVGKVPLAVFSVIFFVIVLLLSIRPNKVVDIIGKILTPVLVLSLVLLILVGIIMPKAAPAAPVTTNVARDGILNGYQTMDLLAAMFFSVIIINGASQKGYATRKSKTGITVKASIIAGILLFAVYGGLAYIGASTGSLWQTGVLDGTVNQAALLIYITEALLGKPGVIILGIVVACACLTTAIGLTSAAAEYFRDLSKGKLKYEYVVIAVCIISALMCNLGVTEIINIAAPVLTVIYPLSVFLVFSVFLHGKVKNVNAYIGAAAVTFAISLITVIYDLTGAQSIAWVHNALPLDSYGFNWAAPCVAAFLIGMCVPGKKLSDIIVPAEK